MSPWNSNYAQITGIQPDNGIGTAEAGRYGTAHQRHGRPGQDGALAGVEAADPGAPEEEDSSVREVPWSKRQGRKGVGRHARPGARYRILERIASGGMASVYLGQHVGPEGFTRAVAIKKLHPAYAEDPEFVAMLFDEARIAARIRHPNVVATLDIERNDGEVSLIMEYVEGAPLSQLLRAASQVGCLPSPAVVTGILVQLLQGLHAAHKACGEDGAPLGIVHRDISPQNIMLGAEGIVRIVDFGIAKAASRSTSTRGGQVKGKLRYLSPEQLCGHSVDSRSDLFSAAVVLWECLTGRRLFDGQSPGEIMGRILADDVPPPSRYARVSSALCRVVQRALSYDASERFGSARDLARALALAEPPASTIEIGAWVEHVSGQHLRERASGVARAEMNSLVETCELSLDELMTPKDSVAHTVIQYVNAGPANECDDGGLGEWTAQTARARRTRLAGVASVAALVVIAAMFAAFLLSGPTPQLERERTRRAQAPTAVATQPTARVNQQPHEAAKPIAEHQARSPRPSADSPSVTAKSCNPPYVVNADGTKRFLRECF